MIVYFVVSVKGQKQTDPTSKSCPGFAENWRKYFTTVNKVITIICLIWCCEWVVSGNAAEPWDIDVT